MKKFVGIVLVLILLINTTIYANTHVVCEMTVLSENSANLRLLWSDNSIKTNIQITTWAKEGDRLVIYYKVGSSVPKGFNSRTIETEDYRFPMKIRLVEQGQEEAVFSDLEDTHEAYDSIMNLYYQNIINGYTTGDFRPDHLVQRSEFSKMVTLTAKYQLEKDKTSIYTDLQDNYWAFDYIMTLSDKGIFTGYTDGSFKPGGQIRISEVLKVIAVTFNFYGQSSAYPYPLEANWSNEYFESLVKSGIVKSTDDFYYPYQPNAYATRAQCAQLLSRAIEVLSDTVD